jgi:anaerobic ribonucleoside-triphosphate reductase
VPGWCKNQLSSPAGVIVGTETISEIVSNYELTIACDQCGAQTPKTIGWIRLQRDMKCPQCDAVIVLNTSRITGTIRSVERRLGDLQSQLTERILKL